MRRFSISRFDSKSLATKSPSPPRQRGAFGKRPTNPVSMMDRTGSAHKAIKAGSANDKICASKAFVLVRNSSSPSSLLPPFLSLATSGLTSSVWTCAFLRTCDRFRRYPTVIPVPHTAPLKYLGCGPTMALADRQGSGRIGVAGLWKGWRLQVTPWPMAMAMVIQRAERKEKTNRSLSIVSFKLLHSDWNWKPCDKHKKMNKGKALSNNHCLLILFSFSAAVLKWLLQTTQGDSEMCIQNYCDTSNRSRMPSFPKLHKNREWV